MIVEAATCWSWEQSSESRSSESGWGSTMDLGSGLAGLGLAGGGAHRPFCLPRACAPASGRWEGSEDLPRGAHLDWPENAGSTGSSNLFLWSTFNSHNAFPFSWAWLQRALEVLVINI